MTDPYRPADAQSNPLRHDGGVICPACERRESEWPYRRKRLTPKAEYRGYTTQIYVCPHCRFEFALRGG